MSRSKSWLPRKILLVCALLLGAGTAVAHHSGAMFDSKARVTIAGSVRAFQWTNPHCYVQLVVKNKAGQEEEWSIEMAAPMYLYNIGWRPSSLKAGDQITVTLSPLRNGSRGGLMIEARRADGKLVGSKP
jgi:Family of unknown function (DUF6152)